MTYTSLTKDPRSKTLELVETGILDKDSLISALLSYMSWDEVSDCVWTNFEIDLSGREE
jgi:hypothetical protein